MKLSLDFAGGDRLSVDVLDVCPETRAALSDALPISATALQARWAGREFFLPVNLRTKPPREHQSIRVAIGDVIYFREWEGAYENTGFEAIGVFYGNEIVREWRGDAPVNVFGRIDPSQFPLLEAIGDRVWRGGAQPVTVTRS